MFRTILKVVIFLVLAGVIYYLNTFTYLNHFLVFMIAVLLLVIFRLFVTAIHGLSTILLMVSSGISLYLLLVYNPYGLVPMPLLFLSLAATGVFILWDFLTTD